MDAITPIRIVWAALTMSVFLYAALPFVVEPTGGDASALLVPLAVAAAGAAVASMFARRAILGGFGLVAPPQEPVGQRASVEDAAVAWKAAVVRYQQATIVGCALGEAVGLLGLVLALLGAPYAHALPFFGVSLIVLLVQFPRPEIAAGLLPPAVRAAL